MMKVKSDVEAFQKENEQRAEALRQGNYFIEKLLCSNLLINFIPTLL